MSSIIPFVLCVGSEQLPLEMGVVCDPDNKDPAVQSALYGLAFLVCRLARDMLGRDSGDRVAKRSKHLAI
jgi:hypothetical protein